MHKNAHTHTHTLSLMHHFSISHWEREASRLRRVVKRRHRTEQLLFTGWFTYTNSELSALKDHHRRRKQSIITVVFLFFNLKRMESERGRASLAFSIYNKGAEYFLRTVWTKWKPCFFTVYCLLSVLPSHNACTELTPFPASSTLHTHISYLFCSRLHF